MVSAVIKSLYTNIYSQVHSQQHGLLLAGNNSGEILIYDISGLIQRDESGGARTERPSGPVGGVVAHSSPIYSLAHSPSVVAAGSIGTISLWKWSALANCTSHTPKAAKIIKLESDQANFGAVEVNSLAYDNCKSLLWAACGDWKTRAYSLQTGKLVTTLEGHKDYVHQVAVCDGASVVTCGEDGQVLLWDPRTPQQPTKTIVPHKEQALARPQLGKFIKSVDYCAGEWLVCGGGPRAGVFHLRSGGLITPLPPTDPSHAVNVIAFTKPNDASSIVTAGGDTGAVTVCNLSGQVTAHIPSSARCVYSVGVSHDKHMVMSIAGLGNKIDLCRNMNYRDHSVSTVWEH